MKNADTFLNKKKLTDTNLLLIITIAIFIGIYGISMLIWGGGFLNPQQFLNIFNTTGYLIILACGLTVVMISGGIDISVGGITCLVTMVCAVYLEGTGASVLGMILISLGVGLAFGLVQGFLTSYLEIQPFIVTLAGMFFAKGMTTIVSAMPRSPDNPAFVALRDATVEIPALGTTTRGGFVAAELELEAFIALGVVLIIFVVLKWTRFGRNLYAVGGNSQSALMLGINVKRTKFIAHALSGLLAGVAGLAYLLNTGGANPTNVQGAEMRAIASAIIGGTLLTGGVGNVIGTMFGSFTLLTISNIVRTARLRDPWWQEITVGALLLIFIVMQSIILSQRGKGGIRNLFGQRKSGASGVAVNAGTNIDMNTDNNKEE